MEKLRDVFTKFSSQKRYIFLTNFTFILTILLTLALTIHGFAVAIPSRWLALGLTIYISILCTVYYFRAKKFTIVLYFIGLVGSITAWAYLRGDTTILSYLAIIFIISSLFLNFKFTTGLFVFTVINFVVISLLLALNVLASSLGGMQLELMSIVHFPICVVGYIVSYIVGKLLLESFNTQQKQLKLLKNTQNQLISQAKLKGIQILAGGVAHDFNNLLTAILGNLNLASTEIPPDSPIFDLIKEAEMASIQARELTTQLLEFSRDTAPAVEIIKIQSLIIRGSNFGSSGSNVKVELDIAEDLWKIKGDPTQLTQVFQNLTINSRDAMPHGGILKIASSNCHIGEINTYQLKQGDYIQIQFVDSGIGIEPELVDKVFTPYFSTKEKDKGYGLGLAICHTIIKNHRGSISLESEKGKGTKFEIFLPRYDEIA